MRCIERRYDRFKPIKKSKCVIQYDAENLQKLSGVAKYFFEIFAILM